MLGQPLTRRQIEDVDIRIGHQLTDEVPTFHFGTVAAVTPNLFVFSAYLDGATTPTPGIRYGATSVTLGVGDTVLVLSRRRDGLNVLQAVLGRNAAASSI